MKGSSIRLNEFIALADADVKIPSTPNRLSGEINNLRFKFQKVGVTIETSTTSNSSRYIRLSLVKTE